MGRVWYSAVLGPALEKPQWPIGGILLEKTNRSHGEDQCSFMDQQGPQFAQVENASQACRTLKHSAQEETKY